MKHFLVSLAIECRCSSQTQDTNNCRLGRAGFPRLSFKFTQRLMVMGGKPPSQPAIVRILSHSLRRHGVISMNRIRYERSTNSRREPAFACRARHSAPAGVLEI